MMCHYALPYSQGDTLRDRVLFGDYHAFNATVWDCTRDEAKTGLYALIYGCGEAKLASSLGKPAGQGGKLFSLFWQSAPALRMLIDDLDAAMSSGRDIYGIDRRVLSIREKRMGLNTLLQGGAAVVFKHWMRMCDDYIQDWNASVYKKGGGAYVYQMIAYHDELQFEIATTNIPAAKAVAKDLSALAGKAGDLLGIRVPIEAEAKVGCNWAETH
jgi:DNA polymerase I-like protein with 3'-5' exonuclease and polymerase domains